jgi:hypothetical protein
MQKKSDHHNSRGQILAAGAAMFSIFQSMDGDPSAPAPRSSAPAQTWSPMHSEI